jgi:hypothetical protein
MHKPALPGQSGLGRLPSLRHVSQVRPLPGVGGVLGEHVLDFLTVWPSIAPWGFAVGAALLALASVCIAVVWALVCVAVVWRTGSTEGLRDIAVVVAATMSPCFRCLLRKKYLSADE